ncbi:MAG TPA: hypothetical protein VKA10_03900, partial [Prolixibacteraceae bacterium]|nr:hypothetical protein [Prolixibacteraceae bacterium]
MSGRMNSNGGGLHYVGHKKIDYKKWDLCVSNAGNSRVYAMSWHLDRTAEMWDALILGDYDFVMPLPIKRKWGINYIYQPLFSQQLGIFPAPSNEVAQLFYTKVVQIFRYSDVQLNSQNPVLSSKKAQFVQRSNFLLDLTKNYQDISKAYSKNTKRNVSKSAKNQLNYVAGLRMEDYMDFKKNNLQATLSNEDFKRLKSVIANAQYKGIGEISGVYNTSNRLCAAVYFCRWK